MKDLPPFDLFNDGARVLRCVALADLPKAGIETFGAFMRALATGDDEAKGRHTAALLLHFLPDLTDEDLGELFRRPDGASISARLMQHAQGNGGKPLPPSSSTDPTRRHKHWT